MDKKIKIEYLLGGWNPQVWEGTKKEAMQIALAEIHEHAGGSSPAYIFTEKIFATIEKEDLATVKQFKMEAEDMAAEIGQLKNLVGRLERSNK